MDSFNLEDGSIIVDNLINTIQDNKQYLSDIDGLIGDGDHGVNMNKGFTMCRSELEKQSGDLTYKFKILSRVLMMNIGGSMGPLYGKFFRGMFKSLQGKEQVDAQVFAGMLHAARAGIGEVSQAKVGDKTLIDTLDPAIKAYDDALAAGDSFAAALEKMTAAAIRGRDSTQELIAKVGRASRLGERSKGALDPGAVSCCLILESMAKSCKTLMD